MEKVQKCEVQKLVLILASQLRQGYLGSLLHSVFQNNCKASVHYSISVYSTCLGSPSLYAAKSRFRDEAPNLKAGNVLVIQGV
jgi:hypothetical protein